MLQKNDIVAFVPTNDATKSKAFYKDVLGLRFVSDDGFALVFNANGTMIRIARAGKFTPQQFTILGWQVKKIEQVVKKMQAKGVEFLHFPGMGQAESGVWNAPDGTAKVAWFKDPDGNTLSVSEHFK
jgi:catechol 2,3-dioxygenase-like lactoylglutathione lyase family enzyme